MKPPFRTLGSLAEFRNPPTGVCFYNPLELDGGEAYRTQWQRFARPGISARLDQLTARLASSSAAHGNEQMAATELPPYENSAVLGELSLCLRLSRQIELPHYSWTQHEKLSYYDQLFAFLGETRPSLIWVPFCVINHYFHISPAGNHKVSVDTHPKQGVPYTFQAIQHLLQHLPQIHTMLVAAPNTKFEEFMTQPTPTAFPTPDEP